jgi:hypothetical protein
MFPGVGCTTLRGHLSSASCTVWAGSAAAALLVIDHDSWWAIAYLLLFGIGTIARMMLITAVIAMPFAFTFNKFAGWNRIVGVTSGVLSGGRFVSCFVDGLFILHPVVSIRPAWWHCHGTR